MGIKNLNSLITNQTKTAKMDKHLSSFAGKVFAIDIYVYLYKFLYGKNNHINGLFFMINKLKKFNIIPIFVFDGKPPSQKNETIQARRDIKNKLKNKLSNLKLDLEKELEPENRKKIQNEIEKIGKRIIYVTKEIINKSQKLLDLMGIYYINANCEAEHYCSKLCKLGLVDGVISEDMDTVACGSKIVLRNYSNRRDNVECIYLKNILNEWDIKYTSFVDLCILLGTDYNSRPSKYSTLDVLLIIKKYSNIENIKKNNLLNSWECQINDIRNLIKLNNIEIDKNILISQLNKCANLNGLKLFLEKESDIEKKIYLNRINLIYFCNTISNNSLYRFKKKILNLN